MLFKLFKALVKHGANKTLKAFLTEMNTSNPAYTFICVLGNPEPMKCNLKQALSDNHSVVFR